MTAQKKLSSDYGASISVALLLFLVCAVLGAVVLTAATASSGRVSELAEMDQRYYSVSSAAELLEKELCGKEVTVERTREIEKETVFTAVTTYWTDVEGKPHSSTTESVSTQKHLTYDTDIKDEASQPDTVRKSSEPAAAWDCPDPTVPAGEGRELSGAADFLTWKALTLLFGQTPECNTDPAWGKTFSGGIDSAVTDSFTITHDGSDLNKALGVKGECRMERDGSLRFRIRSDPGTENGDFYQLTLTLRPEIEENETTESSTESSQDYSGDETSYTYTYTETTKTKVTKTSTISWSVVGIE